MKGDNQKSVSVCKSSLKNIIGSWNTVLDFLAWKQTKKQMNFNQKPVKSTEILLSKDSQYT